MRTLLTIATLVAATLPSSSAAQADTSHDSPTELQLRAAERQERADSLTERFEADQTTIAERDLDSARLRITVTNDAWQRALRENHPAEAGTWAREHYDAMVALRTAEGQYENHRAGRELARKEFQRDSQLVHMLQQRLIDLQARR
jgi:hypothetical protein